MKRVFLLWFLLMMAGVCLQAQNIMTAERLSELASWLNSSFPRSGVCTS